MRPPHRLADRAHADLDVIRHAIETSGRFTAVPGRATVAMGVLAFAGAAVATQAPDPISWAWTWIAVAVVAAVVGGDGLRRKARDQGTSVLHGAGRKFLLGLCPGLAAGALITALLLGADLPQLLPAVWLVSYGAAATSAGAASVRVVPLTGTCFLVLGMVAAIAPTAWGDALMAIGFGGLHVAFGAVIVRRHGG